MAAYIASATAASNGADFTLADAASATLNLLVANDQVPSDAGAKVQIKQSDNTYLTVGTLNAANPSVSVFGPGTYRVAKGQATVAFGVDKS